MEDQDIIEAYVREVSQDEARQRDFTIGLAMGSDVPAQVVAWMVMGVVGFDILLPPAVRGDN